MPITENRVLAIALYFFIQKKKVVDKNNRKNEEMDIKSMKFYI